MPLHISEMQKCCFIFNIQLGHSCTIVPCENVSPNIEEKHGNKIKQPSLAWNNNRKPNKGDLPQPPLSWLYPNQSRGFYDNQSWNSGGSRQNQSQWEAPVS